MIFEVAGIKIETVRKRVKNIRLSIKKDGRVLLTLPYFAAQKEGEDFALKHADWLKKHLDKTAQTPKKEKPTFSDGESFYLFGEKLVIKVVPSAKTQICIEGGELRIFIKGNDLSRRESAVKKFRSQKLLGYACERIGFYNEVFDLTCAGVKTRAMTTRWGSCNVKTKVVTLNVALSEKPYECVDYVILHELIHTRVPNHGKDFYALFDRLMPDHRYLREKLNEKA